MLLFLLAIVVGSTAFTADVTAEKKVTVQRSCSSWGPEFPDAQDFGSEGIQWYSCRTRTCYDFVWPANSITPTVITTSETNCVPVAN